MYRNLLPRLRCFQSLRVLACVGQGWQEALSLPVCHGWGVGACHMASPQPPGHQGPLPTRAPPARDAGMCPSSTLGLRVPGHASLPGTWPAADRGAQECGVGGGSSQPAPEPKVNSPLCPPGPKAFPEPTLPPALLTAQCLPHPCPGVDPVRLQEAEWVPQAALLGAAGFRRQCQDAPEGPAGWADTGERPRARPGLR